MEIVHGTDLSSASEASIRSETCLGCLGRIGVEKYHLVNVAPDYLHTGVPGMGFEERREEDLAEYAAVLDDHGFDVETHMLRGTPHRQINDVAETVGADMILIGSRGKSPLEERVIGSTARNMARTTVAPLFVNRVEREVEDPELVETELFNSMLVATDFSENADRALDSFSYLQKAAETVVLTHVRSSQDKGETTGIDPEDELSDIAARLEDMGIDTTVDVRSGDPAAGILAAEDDHEPATIMVGTRGQSRLRRLLLGSVSEEIVARAAGNVFLVPPE